jgi:hypothetical protein
MAVESLDRGARARLPPLTSAHTKPPKGPFAGREFVGPTESTAAWAGGAPNGEIAPAARAASTAADFSRRIVCFLSILKGSLRNHPINNAPTTTLCVKWLTLGLFHGLSPRSPGRVRAEDVFSAADYDAAAGAVVARCRRGLIGGRAGPSRHAFWNGAAVWESRRGAKGQGICAMRHSAPVWER